MTRAHPLQPGTALAHARTSPVQQQSESLPPSTVQICSTVMMAFVKIACNADV